MTKSTSVQDSLAAFSGFDEAARYSLQFLRNHLGFNLWMVTRAEGDDWIVLEAEDHGYGVKRGDVFRWSDSFCSRMVRGEGPQMAPRSAEVPAYVTAPIGRQVPIEAYIGIPLSRADGSLFGTLCAIDPEPQPVLIREQWPLVRLVARLLSSIIDSELQVRQLERQVVLINDESLRDVLTDLYNRRGWEQAIAAEEQRCQRYGSPAAVAIIDLDDLKTINDRDGHAAGDDLIRRAGSVLATAVRGTDVVARIGGDEFAVLMVEARPGHAEAEVSRIQAAFEQAGVDASIGWAMRDPRSDLDTAIRLADEDMYRIKHGRRS